MKFVTKFVLGVGALAAAYSAGRFHVELDDAVNDYILKDEQVSRIARDGSGEGEIVGDGQIEMVKSMLEERDQNAAVYWDQGSLVLWQTQDLEGQEFLLFYRSNPNGAQILIADAGANYLGKPSRRGEEDRILMPSFKGRFNQIPSGSPQRFVSDFYTGQMAVAVNKIPKIGSSEEERGPDIEARLNVMGNAASLLQEAAQL